MCFVAILHDLGKFQPQPNTFTATIFDEISLKFAFHSPIFTKSARWMFLSGYIAQVSCVVVQRRQGMLGTAVTLFDAFVGGMHYQTFSLLVMRSGIHTAVFNVMLDSPIIFV